MNSATTRSDRLSITLTGRRPVSVHKQHWPIVAEASSRWHDGEIESQANRRMKSRLVVRQHADGPAIVYGVYSYDTHWQHENNVEYRGGEVVEVTDGAAPDLPAAIQRVGAALAARIDGDGARTMRELIHECIADLPAEAR